MRTWTRAEWDHMCGICARPIRRGHLVQVIAITGLASRKVRCVLCADGAPPDDIPPLPDRVVVSPRTKRMEPAGAVAPRALSALQADWPSKGSGD